MNVITNESLEVLDVVKTYEMKNLEETNFKTVLLERIKKNLEEFKMNILETELKEKIWNEARKILKEMNESDWIIMSKTYWN